MPIIAIILLSLCTEKYSGALKCLQILATFWKRLTFKKFSSIPFFFDWSRLEYIFFSEYLSYIVHTTYVATARKRLESETEKLQMRVLMYLKSFQMHLSITTKVSWEKTGVLKIMFITLFRAIKYEGAGGQGGSRHLSLWQIS